MKILKQDIINLENEKNILEIRLNTINKELMKLRRICEHINDDGSNSFVYNSTNMHSDFYKCTICGYIKKK